MSADKRKRKARAYAMIREMNARSFHPCVGLCAPTISRRPGPDLRYAIKRGMVKLRRVSRFANVARTHVDTGFWPFR